MVDLKHFGAPRVLVARPYPTRLRDRVWDVLRAVGLDMDAAARIPSGTSDADAIARIADDPPDVLLVPFNAHRDANAQPVDGLSLCRALAAARLSPPLPIIMPVSRMAGANLRLSRSSGPHGALNRELLDHQILVLAPDELDASDTPKRVVDHLRAHGVSVGRPGARPT